MSLLSSRDVVVSWITTQADRTEHAVTDDAQVAGMAAGHGVFAAMCGAEFLAACMDVGPRGRCPSCRRLLRPQPEPSEPEERAAGWLTRLLTATTTR